MVGHPELAELRKGEDALQRGKRDVVHAVVLAVAPQVDGPQITHTVQ